MATVKLKQPPAPTGNAGVDIQELYSHQKYMVAQLNYILNNLDDENIISDDEKESEEQK